MAMDMDLPDTPAFHATFHGLHKWSNCKFEKLGWMLLAKRDGHDSKIKAYKESLKNLCCDLKARIEVTQDQDRKVDLIILLRNSEYLLEAAERILDSGIASAAEKAATKRLSTKRMSTKRISTTKRMSTIRMSTKRVSTKPKSTKRKSATKRKGLLSFL